MDKSAFRPYVVEVLHKNGMHSGSATMAADLIFEGFVGRGNSLLTTINEILWFRDAPFRLKIFREINEKLC